MFRARNESSKTNDKSYRGNGSCYYVVSSKIGLHGVGLVVDEGGFGG